ncbi:hypothetical protein CVS40_12685 [Lucilia cuprina]|nr:hypothetical protein CVS40_12685 [Lucilia cuprina]
MFSNSMWPCGVTMFCLRSLRLRTTCRIKISERNKCTSNTIIIVQ